MKIIVFKEYQWTAEPRTFRIDHHPDVIIRLLDHDTEPMVETLMNVRNRIWTRRQLVVLKGKLWGAR